MKKLLSILLTLAMLSLTITGCGLLPEELDNFLFGVPIEEDAPEQEEGEANNETVTAPPVQAESPAPAPVTTTPEYANYEELIGTWNWGRGDWIWYFADSGKIDFYIGPDDVLTAMEYANDEWAVWHIDNRGVLCLDTQMGQYREFTFFIEGNTLTLIDEDGDTRQYDRAESDGYVSSGSGRVFPYPFTATDIYGNTVTEASLGEKEIYFVHLWATWCPPCLDEMPEFPALIAQYGDRVGFLGLISDFSDNQSGAANIVSNAGIPDSFVMIDAINLDLLSLVLALDSGYVPTSLIITADGMGEQIVGSYGMGYAEFLDEALGN